MGYAFILSNFLNFKRGNFSIVSVFLFLFVLSGNNRLCYKSASVAGILHFYILNLFSLLVFFNGTNSVALVH